VKNRLERALDRAGRKSLVDDSWEIQGTASLIRRSPGVPQGSIVLRDEHGIDHCVDVMVLIQSKHTIC